jgi:type IV fimbrial biogenesis protein FimT/type IV fimbrial biogenesis protein FimU
LAFAVMPYKVKNTYNQGFTLTEVLIGIAIIGIISAVAMPSLNSFLIQMRVDSQISEIQRMVLTARNTAINLGQRTTLCPLAEDNTCTNNWQNSLSVFIDLNGNDTLNDDDILIKVKSAVTSIDNLTYSQNLPLSYLPTGIIIANSNGSFTYCPSDTTYRRGIQISASGRATISSDLDDDDIDEFIGNPIVELTCQ